MGSKKKRNPVIAVGETGHGSGSAHIVRNNRGAGKVLVGQVHGDRVHPRWALNMRLVERRDAMMESRILGVLDTNASGAHVATGRCKIVADFLKHPSHPEWLWMVDTDATFEATILDQLLESADPVSRPIVGALAFGLRPALDEYGREMVNALGAGPVEAFPTLYLLDMEQQKSFRVMSYPADSMVPVDGTGCHCLLVHRSVFEHPIWDLTHPLPWFRSGTAWGAGEVSEDLFFCMGARAAGFPVFVNTAAKTGHIKEVVIDEEFYLAQVDAAGGGHRPRVVLVPSRDPVLCRTTVTEILRSGGHGELIVAWNGTNRAFREWLETQPVTVVDADRTDGIHVWWNWAIDNRPDADIMLLNDDLRFAPNFVPGLFERLYLEPRVAAVCPNYDARPGTGMTQVEGICAGRYDGTGGLSGFAFALSRDWLDATGYRFPADAKWWCGDNDLMATIASLGHVAAMALDVPCEHLGGKTGDWDGELAEQCRADMEWFRSKWQPVAEPMRRFGVMLDDVTA